MMTLAVDVWSDLLCPWCYIGKRRFEKALSTFPHRDAVQVRWRSFELDPTMDTAPTTTVPERLQKDFGLSPEEAEQRLAMISELAAAEQLTFRLDRAMSVNSFDAHRLAHWGDAMGKSDAVRERLFRAYTSEGAVLSDHDTLVQLAAEAGLSADAARTMLAGDDYRDAVRADEQEAARLGVHSVPTFVFAGRYAVAGAQPAEIFGEVLTQMWKRQTSEVSAEVSAGAACRVDGGC